MTQSDSNKTLMQDIFARVAQGDGSMFLEHLHEDAVMTVTGQHSWSQVIRGKQRILKDLYGYLNSLLAQRGKTHPFRFLADDDWVVIEARGEMLAKSGEKYENHYCLLYRLERGMIVEMKEYQDSALCERVLGSYPEHLKQSATA